MWSLPPRAGLEGDIPLDSSEDNLCPRRRSIGSSLVAGAWGMMANLCVFLVCRFGRIFRWILVVPAASFVCRGDRRSSGQSTVPGRPRHHRHRRSPRARLAVVARASLCTCFGAGFYLPSARATDGEFLHRFDIPAGGAAATLRQYISQSGEQLLFSSDDVDGVQTQAVAGHFTSRDALLRMLTGTPLRVRFDDVSTAVAVTRIRPARAGPEADASHPVPNTSIPQPSPSMPKRSSILSFFKLMLAATAATPAIAVDAKSSDTDPLVLSPFKVETARDDGYMAADVISAGLLATNLLKTPADITVLTRDFLNDIGVIRLQDAQGWLTNSDPSPGTDQRDFGNSVSFRGQVASSNTRNFFRQGYTPEEYNTERVEGSRGPNSILYGDSNAGGQINIGTKQPKFTHDFQSIRLRFDSEGSAEAAIDVNRRIGDKFGIRVNARALRGRSWLDDYYNNRYGLAIALAYRPWHGAEIRFELERDYLDYMNFRPDFFQESVSSWDRTTTISAPLTSNPSAGSGLNRLGTFYVFNEYTGKLQNWQNFARTNGTNLSALPDPNLRPFGPWDKQPRTPRRSFTGQNQSVHIGVQNHNYTLIAEQKFDSGLVVEVAGDFNLPIRSGGSVNQNTQVWLDVNRVQPDGTPNPNFGKYFSQNNGGLRPHTQTLDIYTAGRVAAAYPIKTSKFTQLLSAVAQYRHHVFDVESHQLYRVAPIMSTNGTTLNPVNLVQHWQYWDERGDRDVPLPKDDASNTYRYINTRDTRNMDRLESIQFNTVGTYFGDRVTLVAGIRHDRFHGATRDTDRRDTVTGDPISTKGISTDASVTTHSIGASYFPLPTFGFYSNWSEGFRPSIANQPQLDGGAAVNMAIAKSYGHGIRLNLFKGRLVGSAGYYHSVEEKRLTQNLNLNPILNLWDAVGQPNMKPPQTGTFVQYSDTTDLEAFGWEADLTANIVKGFRIKGNVAFPETRQTNGFPGTRAYYEQHIATWRAAQSNPEFNQAVISQGILAMENTIQSGNPGRPQNGLFDYRVNVFGNYEIQSGPLKKLRFGAGAQFFSRRIIFSKVGAPFDYVYADPFHLVTASLGYSFKFRNLPVDVQINVSNLLDYDDPIWRTNGNLAVGGQNIPNLFYWENPRLIRLTLTTRY